jgi:acyl-CoA thioester hydrolase
MQYVKSKRASIGGTTPGLDGPYLEETAVIRVRFNEVDALHIVWHGHYVNYFEEARRAFGRRYGVDYTVFVEHRIAIPVVQLRVDYFAPARLADTIEVRACLLKTEAARFNFLYEARRQGENTLLASGSSVQVFTTPDGELLLNWPDFVQERLRSWEPLWKRP